jgi:hypothetical protein
LTAKNNYQAVTASARMKPLVMDLLRVFSFYLSPSNTPSHINVRDFIPLTTTYLDNIAEPQRFQLLTTHLYMSLSRLRWAHLEPCFKVHSV